MDLCVGKLASTYKIPINSEQVRYDPQSFFRSVLEKRKKNCKDSDEDFSTVSDFISKNFLYSKFIHETLEIETPGKKK